MLTVTRVVNAKGFRRGRRGWYAGVAAVALVVLGVVLALWVTREPEPRARQYLDFTACLLTDAQGVAGPEAAAAWASMQEASLETRAKVQYLAVAGEQTTANALTFLASLAQSNCSLVFAAGDLPRDAVVAGAGRFPGVKFVIVGSGPTAPNVSTVDKSGVGHLLEEAIRAG